MRIHRNCLVVPVCALGIVVGCSSGSSSFGDEPDSGMTVEQGDGAPNTNGGDSGIQPGTDGGNPGNNDSGSGGNKDAGAGQKDSGSGGTDAGGGKDSGPQGGAITCPGPGNPKSYGSTCGSERWNIKTGTDSQAPSVSLVPQVTTIATLTALPAAGGGSSRESPTETTLWELKDVTLTEIKSETDDDYHLVIADNANHTMIAEIPSPGCDTGGAWTCFISKARSDLDAKYSPGSYPAATVTIRGVGFFDFAHGQTGVAPNAIELHPVLQICFGQGCTPS